MKKIPLIAVEDIESKTPGIDPTTVNKLISYFNVLFEKRTTPLYIFFNPDVIQHAEKIQADPKAVFTSLNFLSSHFMDEIKHEVILDYDGLFYKLQEEDLLELKTKNQLHNPDDPRTVYGNARDLVRHAFVVELKPDEAG